MYIDMLDVATSPAYLGCLQRRSCADVRRCNLMTQTSGMHAFNGPVFLEILLFSAFTNVFVSPEDTESSTQARQHTEFAPQHRALLRRCAKQSMPT